MDRNYPLGPSIRIAHALVVLLVCMAGPALLASCEVIVEGGASFSLGGAPGSVDQGAPVNFALTITAVDVSGVVTDYAGTIRFSSSDAGATLPPDVVMSASDGGTITVPVTVTFATAGAQTLRAFDPADPTVQGSVVITVIGAAVTALELSNLTSPLPVGTPTSFLLTARNSVGGAAAGYRGTVRFSSTDALATLPPDYTFTAADAGDHVFTDAVTFQTGGPQALTVVDLANGSLLDTAVVLVAGGVAVDHLDVTGLPDPAQVGVANALTLTARDSTGAVVTTYTGTVAFTSTDSSAILPAPYTFTPGDLGTVTLPAAVEFRTAGTQSVTATDTAMPTLTDTLQVMVDPGPAVSIVAFDLQFQPERGPADDFTIRLYDVGGNIATGYTGTIEFLCTDIGATLPAPYAFTPAGMGEHAFAPGVTYTQLGAVDFTAQDTVNPSLTETYNLDVQPAPPALLLFTTQPSTVDMGVPFTTPLEVTLQDAYGYLADTATNPVVLAIDTNPSQAQLSGTRSRTPVAGVVSFDGIAVSRPGGAFTLRAVAVGLTTAISDPFDVNATGPIEPSVANLSVFPPLGGHIPISYELSQATGERADVLIEFDPGTGIFQRATATGAGGTSGVRGLATSPGSPGMLHNFVWDSVRDVPGYQAGVRIRITPSIPGATGTPALLTGLTIQNGAGFNSGTPTTLGADIERIATGDLDRDGRIDMVALAPATGNVHGLAGDGALGFTATFNLSEGTLPADIALADINRDGRLDLISAIEGDDVVSVRLGDGAGSFGIATTIATPPGPAAVAIGDVDNDGAPDIVVACATVSLLAVLRNTTPIGSATPAFTTSGTIPINGGPRAVALLHLNSDAVLDVAACCTITNTVDLLHGDGAGGLIPNTSLNVGLFPQRIAVGDLDRSGWPDAVVICRDDATAHVLLDTSGAGTLTAGPVLTTGLLPADVVAGDLNQDGRLDLCIASAGDNRVDLFEGDGTGAFTATFTLPIADQPVALAFARLDWGGALDLAIGRRAGQDVLGASNWLPLTGTSFATGFNADTLDTVAALAAGDLNRDGNLDVISASDGANNAIVMFGESSGMFSPIAQTIATPTLPRGVVLGDFNHDDFLDAALMCRSPAMVAVLFNDGFGLFAAGPTTAIPGDPVALARGDLNADGLLDLVIAHSTTTRLLQVLLGDGAGGFLALAPLTIAANTADIAIGDLNEDGDLDVVITAPGLQATTYFGDGTGALTLGASHGPGAGSAPTDIAVGYVDSDAHLDLVFNDPGGNTLRLLRGDGTGNFPTSITIAAGSGPSSVALGDIDGDGDTDIACGTLGGPGDRLHVLIGDGSGAIWTPHVHPLDGSPLRVIVAEFTSDLRDDILIGCSGRHISLFVADGAAVRGGVNSGSPSRPAGAGVADIDRDGDLDALVAESFDTTHQITVLNGNGGITFVGATSHAVGDGPRAVGAIDINLDGHLDLVSLNHDAATLSVRLADGLGGYLTAVDTAVASNGFDLAFADVNRDGRPDIVTVHDAPATVTVLTNTTPIGSPSPSFTTAFLGGAAGSGTSLSIGDINRDGAPDILVGNAATSCSMWLNDGVGAFPVLNAVTTPLAVAVDLGDINGDGRLDIVGTGSANTIFGMLGDGAGGFTPPAVFQGPRTPGAIRLHDVDRDGNLDAVIICAIGLAYRFGDGFGGLYAGPIHALDADAHGGRAFALADVNRDGRIDVVTVAPASTSTGSIVTVPGR